MAEKKEASISPANERLQLWLSFAKFCFAVFAICVTVMSVSKEDAKGRIKIAAMKYDSGGDGETEELTQKLAEVKRLYYEGVDLYVNNKIEAAIQSWEKLLKLDPNHADAKKNIERAKAKLNALRAIKK